eukprot:scaffold98424_cov56-Attheya_sp.AAC.1
MDSREKWILSVYSISMSIAFLAVVAHFVAHGTLFVSTKLESLSASLVTTFWVVALPTIMNPSNDIAVSGSNAVNLVISNANIYFFSWASFIAALYIAGSCAQEARGPNDSAIGFEKAKWLGLCASSLIMLSSSSKFFYSYGCSQDGLSSTQTCKRTKYAVSLGVIGTVFATAMVCMASKGNASYTVQVAVSFILFTMYCFGVGYITFENGPGDSISNLYFSTWAGFIISLFLFASSVKQMMAPQNIPKEKDEDVEAVPVESDPESPDKN